MNTPIPACAQRHQRGASLLEVLVTVVIISIGMLGMAKMQLHAAAYNQSAFFRAQATTLAYDIADRIRAAGSTRADEFVTGYGDHLPSNNDCTAPVSTGTLSTSQELESWKGRVRCSMPEGDASIESLSNQLWRISVRWNDARGNRVADGNSAGIETFVYETRLF